MQVARLNNDRAREEARAKEVQEGREAGDTKVDDLCRWSVLGAHYVVRAHTSQADSFDGVLHDTDGHPIGPVVVRGERAALASRVRCSRLSTARHPRSSFPGGFQAARRRSGESGAVAHLSDAVLNLGSC